MKEYIQITFAAIGAWLGAFLGGFDGFLYALIAFVIIDYVTGVMCAIMKKKLSSEIGAKGICKKVTIFILVAIAHIIDCKILGNGGAIRTAVIFFYIANEGISILENTTRIGLPVPQKIKRVLEKLLIEEEVPDESNNKIPDE